MAKAYYIPNGPANLQVLFPGIDFSQVAEYYVELIDTANAVVATSPMNHVCGCDDDDDLIRVHFLNTLGAIDAINMKVIVKDHESKSDSFQKPTQYPLVKINHGTGRFNSRSNDTYKAVTIDYYEEDMDWLDELFDAPLAWIEQPAIQGQEASYTPIVIVDKKTSKQKQEDRYVYQVELEFTLSHEKFIIRN